MKHYDQLEWKLYKKDLLNNSIKKEMEAHLISCEKCMDIFICLIDEKEIKDTENLISKNFTLNIMKEIEEIEKQEIYRNDDELLKLKEKKKENKKRIFLQYISVASITIIITATGFFNRVAASSILMDSNIKREISMTEKVYELSESLVRDFSRSMNDFNIYDLFSK